MACPLGLQKNAESPDHVQTSCLSHSSGRTIVKKNRGGADFQGQLGQVPPEWPADQGVESQRTASDAINLLKLREGDIAEGLPVKSKLNRIRFDEAAEDLRTEYAVNGRRSADELERRMRLHLLPYFPTSAVDASRDHHRRRERVHSEVAEKRDDPR